MTVPAIFNRIARRKTRRLMARHPTADRWLLDTMSDEVLDRLSAVRRRFVRALVIGPGLDPLRFALEAQDIRTFIADREAAGASHSLVAICDEDRLPFADATFDLIIAIGTLDTVDDLPGALILLRRTLKPDGLFLGAMIGAGSLPSMRAAFAGVEEGVARFHPQLDVRAAGDLLGRAGFHLPVAESHQINARYSTIGRLFGDLRANGLTNVLALQHPLSRKKLAKIESAFGTARDEEFQMLVLTGWAPPSN